ncbi:ABC transporter permease [Beijerinckia indica]|uniref:Binding-protein-dependent transport systems inner membrane component n=1 Tax=Beijerinckia indica subsp. indica (strain ATCC 9039 / DSM 1715 / NCIMB 8712) TaxID=395963 RepID=B2IGE1_BEII9|nr:ABC transporter permease [Beijerinckia indica]ACB94326.1 binding-protein-dependent transport systems inner membrane component [Beijerinckia indica subsp. indica ATCC 9039]
MSVSADVIDDGSESAGRPARLGQVALVFKNAHLIGLILPVSLFILWQTATSLNWIDRVFLPPPLAVLKAFWQMLTTQNLALDFFASLSIVGQAFLYGSLAALGLGFAAGLSRKVELFFGPTFDTIRHIPAIAWLPLIVLWLGIGAPAKILVIAKSVFFPVFLNTVQGIRQVERNYVELAKVLTLTRWQFVRQVVLPAAMPSILVSLRYAAGLAWALVVVAEGLSGLEGLGFLIFRAQGLLLTDQLVVCMVIIGLVGFSIDRVMALLQRRLLRWKQGFEG